MGFDMETTCNFGSKLKGVVGVVIAPRMKQK
ncbi:hypothetical protein RDI58_028659 [Solanum bulbocastanum]|uniref:Uncharacterized protein n=1 Tax=Solanum bulbocastanum TaxID=147425 RepID=A0AAN8SWR6_SOLBU